MHMQVNGAQLYGASLQHWSMASRSGVTTLWQAIIESMGRMDQSAGTMNRSVPMQVSLSVARVPIGASITRLTLSS